MLGKMFKMILNYFDLCNNNILKKYGVFKTLEKFDTLSRKQQIV